MSLRVVIDYDKCESNGLCMSFAPEVFEIRDDDFLYILDETPGPELHDRVRTAERTCPKQAITLVEE